MEFISADAGAVVAKCRMDKRGLPDFISATGVHCRALRVVVDEVPILFALIAGLWYEMYTTSGKLSASGSLCRSYKTPSRVSPSTVLYTACQPFAQTIHGYVFVQIRGKFKMMFRSLTRFAKTRETNYTFIKTNKIVCL